MDEREIGLQLLMLEQGSKRAALHDAVSSSHSHLP